MSLNVKHLLILTDNEIDSDLLHYTLRSTMLQAVLTRCSDKSPRFVSSCLLHLFIRSDDTILNHLCILSV